MGCTNSGAEASSKKKPLVTITGVTGYIGSWVALKFLEDGGYRVRGTCRDPTNEKKIAPLRAGFGKYFDRLELVKADLSNEQTIIDAVAGSDYLVHVASIFSFNMNDENMVPTAVNGTMAAMKAC